MAKHEWDLTSESSLRSAAEWVRKRAGALAVVILRVDDLAIAGDPLLPPRDVLTLLDTRAPELHATLEANRQAARALAQRRQEKEARRG